MRRQEVGAAVMWLTHAGMVTPAARRRFATRMMLAAVFAQAALLGLVRCTRCGDRGCDMCRGRVLR